MLAFVLGMTPLRLRWIPDYSDYHPEAPGGRLGGRSVEPAPFDGKRLGAELANLKPPYAKAPLNVVVTHADYRWFNLRKRHPRGQLRTLRVGLRLMAARLTGKHLLGICGPTPTSGSPAGRAPNAARYFWRLRYRTAQGRCNCTTILL